MSYRLRHDIPALSHRPTSDGGGGGGGGGGLTDAFSRSSHLSLMS